MNAQDEPSYSVAEPVAVAVEPDAPDTNPVFVVFFEDETITIVPQIHNLAQMTIHNATLESLAGALEGLLELGLYVRTTHEIAAQLADIDPAWADVPEAVA